MPRYLVVLLCFVPVTTFLLGQNPPASNPQALSFAAQSITALTGGNSIGDATLTGTVTSVLGSDYESGSGTFRAKGISESRVDLSFTGGKVRSDVRNLTGVTPGGAWQTNGGTPQVYAGHNGWTDAVWFFPALSSLSQTANPNFVFKYIGQEQHNGLNSQHIQVFQAVSGNSTAQGLSVMDFYLDPASLLPLSIGFNLHPDSDMKKNVPVTINFANYQSVGGIEVPFLFQQMLNGEVVLNVVVTSTAFNTGLQDSIFTLP